MEFLLLLKKNVNIYLIMKKDILSLSLLSDPTAGFFDNRTTGQQLEGKRRYGGEGKSCAQFWNKKTAQLDVTVAPPLSGDVR